MLVNTNCMWLQKETDTLIKVTVCAGVSKWSPWDFRARSQFIHSVGPPHCDAHTKKCQIFDIDEGEKQL